LIQEKRLSQSRTVFFARPKVLQAAFSPIPSDLALMTWMIRLIGFLIPARKVFVVGEKYRPQAVHR